MVIICIQTSITKPYKSWLWCSGRRQGEGSHLSVVKSQILVSGTFGDDQFLFQPVQTKTTKMVNKDPEDTVWVENRLIGTESGLQPRLRESPSNTRV